MPVNAHRWITVLGRRDTPTDGLEDYCLYLGQALEKWGVRLELIRVPWAEQGWIRSLRRLSERLVKHDAGIALVQYTALGWSRWGFPLGVLALLWVLRRHGLRVAVVFHDVEPFSGRRFRDRVRSKTQAWIMRRLAERADRCVSALPTKQMSWVRPEDLRRKFVTVPIGPNIPESKCSGVREQHQPIVSTTIAVFGVTGGASISREVSDIAYAVSRASRRVSTLRVVVLGRGSREAEGSLREALRNELVEVSVLGLLPAERVACVLADADVFLFVRGHLSGRRGSAIAGIASGLPIVGYAGPETAFPVTEAGVELVPEGDREGLATALSRVVTDHEFRRELQRRSLRAHAEFFSWDRIAHQIVTELF
jgi:glycosyltransferase involved in cell wall biosynthesis